MIYLIGSLRNERVPEIAVRLRKQNIPVFDDWYAAGPTADDCWRDYEKQRGRSFVEAIRTSAAARNVFEFDKKYLTMARAVVLVAPAGKSGHLELGWALGQGKPGFILLDNPDRWDVMYQFATGVYTELDELIEILKETHGTTSTDIPDTDPREDACRGCGIETLESSFSRVVERLAAAAGEAEASNGR